MKDLSKIPQLLAHMKSIEDQNISNQVHNNLFLVKVHQDQHKKMTKTQDQVPLIFKLILVSIANNSRLVKKELILTEKQFLRLAPILQIEAMKLLPLVLKPPIFRKALLDKIKQWTHTLALDHIQCNDCLVKIRRKCKSA